MIFVWCVSDFPKHPTCYRQSSSGNSSPGGGYVNKQCSHKQIKRLIKIGKNRKHTDMQVHFTIYSQHYLLTLTPIITNRHTPMCEDVFIQRNHTNTVTFRNIQYFHAHTLTRTHAQLKHGPRWCFSVCVALRAVRMVETSAPQGLGVGGGEENVTNMIHISSE